MTSIIVLRKGEGRKVLTLTKAREGAIREALRACRVQRPELLAFFLEGGFAGMPSIPQSVIDNPVGREIAFPGVGFVIPEGSLGRAPKSGVRDWQSTSQSILLWVKKYLVDTGFIRIEELSIIVVED
jgi:hypothetical protein